MHSANTSEAIDEKSDNLTYLSVEFEAADDGEHVIEDIDHVLEDLDRVLDDGMERIQIVVGVRADHRAQVQDYVTAVDTKQIHEHEYRLWDEKEGEGSTGRPDPL